MNAWKNPNAISFARAAAAFRSGKDTPRNFLERCIATLEKRESSVKAFVTLDLKAARKAADESTRRYRKGAALSPIDGCPVAVKDIIATADMPTQMNSPVFKGWQSGQDAACVQALRAGGAIAFGKTVTTEFAIGYSGPTTNPFDPQRTPGGSSSGSAAAVGSGMVPVGLGTQTQASTLRPASYCGAVGFKSTLGAFHMGGIHPLSSTCDHLGLLGATLEDVWLVGTQISHGIGSPGFGFLDGAGPLPVAVRPRKLVRLYTRGWTEIDTATGEAFESFVAALAAAGVTIVSRDDDPRVAALEDALEAGVDGALDIVAYEMKWPFADYAARFGKKIGERIHGLIERARGMTPAAYQALLVARRRIQAQLRDTLAAVGADACVTLASSGPAIYGLEYTGSRTFLVYGSWTGFPAFSLPLLEVSGLPVGVQFLGLDGQDGALASAAHWVMREIGGG